MKSTPILTNFTSGELTPLLSGRIDFSRYYNSAETITNFVPLPWGGLQRRPGTYYVAPVKNHSKKSRLIPFQFSTTQAYIVEFAHNVIRFFKDNGQIMEDAVTITDTTQADPIVVTAAGHGYSNGDEVFISSIVGMTEVNGRYFVVANQGVNDFELNDRDGNDIDGTGYTAYVSGGTSEKPYEITSTYDEDYLFGLQVAQDADTMWIIHPYYKPRKLTRTGHSNWTLTKYEPTADPFGSSTTITGATQADPVVITSAAHGYSNGDEVLITEVEGMAQLNGNRYIVTNKNAGDYELYDSGGNSIDGTGYNAYTANGIAENVDDFPSCVTIYEQRIFFANTNNDPQKVFSTKSGAYNDMTVGATDDDGVAYTIGSEQVDAIRWLSAGRVLVMGTFGGNFTVSSGEDNTPITPTNIVVKKETSFGSVALVPKRIGNFIYFVQRNKKTLREFAFNSDIYEHQALDMTLLAEHMTKTGIIDMGYQQSPYNILWCVLGNGNIATLTREISQQVVAWARQTTNGSFESVAVIPGDGGDDEVWVVVNRTIGGATKRYIEYLKPFDFGSEQEDAFFVDSGLTLDSAKVITNTTQADPVVVTSAAHGFSNGDRVIIRGVGGMTELNQRKFLVANKTADNFEITDLSGTDIDGSGYTAYTSGGEVRKCVDTLSGLNHLEGESVDILADGCVSPEKTVASGEITLASSTGKGGEIHAGLNYESKAVTMRVEAGSQLGSAQGKIKRIKKVVVRLYESLGLKAGDAIRQDVIPFRSTSDLMDTYVDLYTGDVDVPFPGTWDKLGQVTLIQDQPLPLVVICLILLLEVSDW